MLDEIGRKREKQIKHLEEISFNLLRDHDPNDYYDCDNAMISEFNLRQASDMREAERDRLNEAAYGRGLIAGAGLTSQAAITTELKQVDTQLIPIGELMERYRGEFNAFCQTNPKHKVSDNKRTQYTSSVIKYLSDVTSPRDLKLYYANHTPAYPTANCRNGLAKFLEFLDITEDIQEINGFPFSEWREALRNFTTSDKAIKLDLMKSGVEKAKAISESEMKMWISEIPDDLKPLVYLLAVSGMRLTQLRSWLMLPLDERIKLTRTIKASDAKDQASHDGRLKSDVILIDASSFSAARKKKSDFALFPSQAYNLLLAPSWSSLPVRETIEARTRPLKLNAMRKKNDSSAGKVTLSVTRKFLMGWLTTNKGVPFVDASLIQCRGTTSDVGIKHYTDPKRHCTIIYSSVVDDLSEVLPAPPLPPVN